jgi:tetratricopeptide (TPR) repeat protein
MELTELARKIREGNRRQLDDFKRLVAGEHDVSALREFADSHWQEDEISIPVYKRVLELNPEDDKAWSYLGLVKLLIGEDAEAVQCLERARKINPDGIEVLTLQAALEKRRDEQLKIYKKMLEQDPTNRVALANLARLQNE